MKWPLRPLGEIATLERIGVQPEEMIPGTLYVGLENIESGGTLSDVKPIGAGELASSKFEFTDKHLLYGKLRPYLRKVARPNFSGICSTDILPIASGPGLDRSFLHHFLLLDSSVDFATTRSTGANLPRISPSILEALPVPIPPLDEQRRIAAILDQAEALRVKRSQTLVKLDTLTQSLFLEMFGKDEVLKSRWPIAPIKSLGRVTTGRTPPGELEGMFDGPVPFVTPGDLNGLMEDGAKRSLSLLGASHVRLARAGATAVCCIGATIGKMGMPRTDFAFNQQINVVEWANEIDDVYGYFALTQLKEEIASRGASTTMPILKKSSFEQLFLPVPPIAMQRTFRVKVEALSGARSSFRRQNLAIDSLFSSLQTTAFGGGL